MRKKLEIARKVFIRNFKAKPKERALILVDEINKKESLSDEERKRRENLKNIAKIFFDAAKSLELKPTLVVYPSTMRHGEEPPEEVWKAAWEEEFIELLKNRGVFEKILNKQRINYQKLLETSKNYKDSRPDIVVALSNFSTSHTVFRRLLTDNGARYASMPLFDEVMLYTCLDVDPEELKPLTEKLVDLLTAADKAKVYAKNGTEMEIPLYEREAISDTGDLSLPGSFSNLPAGEAFIAPVEGKTEGILVIEWAPTKKLSSSVKIEIHEGKAKEVKGEDEYAGYLKDVFSKIENASNVAELGIGTNPKAKRPDNILEAEKILGTIHIAFGDNSTFGGKVKASFHQDYVVFSPTVEIEVDNRWVLLMKDGKLTI